MRRMKKRRAVLGRGTDSGEARGNLSACVIVSQRAYSCAFAYARYN